MDFSSRQLRAFLLVAQHRSFTRAAEALFITPSGLSVLIRELEGQLGVRLFDRTTRHVSLTSYGKKLAPLVRGNLEELDSALSNAGRTAVEAQQSISLGAPPLVAANILPQVIKEFAEYRPGIRVFVFDADLATILHRVEAGKLDLGIGIFQRVAGLRRRRLFRFSLVLIRSGRDVGSPRALVKWSAAAAEKLIFLPPSSPVQQVVSKHLGRAQVRPAMTVNALDTQIAMVEAGQGGAIIPSYGLPVCRSRNVLMSRLVKPAVSMDFHEIRKSGRKLPPAADEFGSFLEEHFAKWAGRAGVL